LGINAGTRVQHSHPRHQRPTTSWTEKARREAAQLVEDVLSSAMIYVSRDGDVSFLSRGQLSVSQNIIDEAVDQ